MNKEASNLLAKLVTEIYKNEQLQQKVNKLETNRDKAINYIKWNATSNYFDEEQNMFRREIDLLEILERGKE